MKRVETSHKTLTVLRCKVALVGGPHVGKSALRAVYAQGNGAYPKTYSMTQNVELDVVHVNIPDTSVQVELFLLDTAGHKVYHHQDSPIPQAWEGANSIMVVYDCADRQSFIDCEDWIARVKEATRKKAIPGVVIANKVDLREHGREAVGPAEGQRLAEKHGLVFFETSAATGVDVDAPFISLANGFFRRFEEHVARADGEA